ncbi:MAG: hypothetical protein AB7V55_01870 [Oscillospiraceae bacterium]
MKNTVKNVLVAIVGIIVIVVLFRFAWTLAGFLIKFALSAGIFLVLLCLVLYFVAQYRRR